MPSIWYVTHVRVEITSGGCVRNQSPSPRVTLSLGHQGMGSQPRFGLTFVTSYVNNNNEGGSGSHDSFREISDI